MDRGAWWATVHGVEKSWHYCDWAQTQHTQKKHSKENEESWVLKLELNKVSQPLNLPEPSSYSEKEITGPVLQGFLAYFSLTGAVLKAQSPFCSTLSSCLALATDLTCPPVNQAPGLSWTVYILMGQICNLTALSTNGTSFDQSSAGESTHKCVSELCQEESTKGSEVGPASNRLQPKFIFSTRDIISLAGLARGPSSASLKFSQTLRICFVTDIHLVYSSAMSLGHLSVGTQQRRGFN